MPPAIVVRNLVKRFGGRAVLDGINLEVQPGETMVIMGGSGAIGTAMAKAFAAEGAKVYLGARGAHRLAVTAEAVRAAGGTAEVFSVDCLDEGATRRAVEALGSIIL